MRIYFGGDPFSRSVATENFLYLGAAGSGKTLSIKLLMKNVLPLIKEEGTNVRALVYDSKPEYLSCLSKMTEKVVNGGVNGERLCEQVYILNPLDERCVAWNIARDIDDPAAALELAAILIPIHEHDNNPFFQNSARHIVYDVTLALHKLFPHEWTLRDLIAILQNVTTVREVLEALPLTKDIASTYLPRGNQRLTTDLIATIQSNLVPFEIIAACWQGKPKISLQDWLKEQWILVLGASEKNRSALDALNQLIFTRAVQLLLDEPDNDQTEGARQQNKREVWFFLDEIRQMGKLDKLNALLTKGRSKGACTVFGLQDIDGFVSIYGEHLVNEILGMTYNKAIFKLNSPASAEWASSLWGSYIPSAAEEEKEAKIRPAMLASSFMGIAKTNPKNNLHGYYLISDDNWYRVAPWDAIIKNQPEEDKKQYPNFIRNLDPEAQYLKRWDEKDINKLAEAKERLFPAEKGSATVPEPPSEQQAHTDASAKTTPLNNPESLDSTVRKSPSWGVRSDALD